MDYFFISEVILLETVDESLIGRVDKVQIAPATNDIYVMDSHATKMVFRFSKDGHFKGTVGAIGEGPGEYERPLDFSLTKDGGLVIGSNRKLSIYDQNDAIIKERRTDHFFTKIGAFANMIATYERHNPERIVFYNNDLAPISYFETADQRPGEKIGPRSMFGTAGGSLFIVRPFHLSFFKVEPDLTQQLHLLSAFNSNDYTPDNYKRTIVSLYGVFNNQAFLQEVYPDRIHYLLFDMSTQTMINFENTSLKEHDYPFDYLAGVAPHGIIVVITDEETFEKHAPKHPELQGLRFNPNDNPILMILEPRT